MNKKKSGYATESASEDEIDQVVQDLKQELKKTTKKTKKTVAKEPVLTKGFDFSSTFNFDPSFIPPSECKKQSSFFFDFPANNETTTAAAIPDYKPCKIVSPIPDFAPFKPCDMFASTTEFKNVKKDFEEAKKENSAYQQEIRDWIKNHEEKTKMEIEQLKSCNDVFYEQISQSTTQKLDEFANILLETKQNPNIKTTVIINKPHLIQKIHDMAFADLNFKVSHFLNDASDAEIVDLQNAVDLIVSKLNIVSLSYGLSKKKQKKTYCEYFFVVFGFVCYFCWILTLL